MLQDGNTYIRRSEKAGNKGRTMEKISWRRNKPIPETKKEDLQSELDYHGYHSTDEMKERVSKLTYPTLQQCLRRLYTMNGNSKH